MRQLNNTSSRKKFLVWGATVFASMTAFKFFSSKKTKESNKPQTIKMLAQDGTLVEVDADKLSCGKKKKVSAEQLKNWVIKK